MRNPIKKKMLLCAVSLLTVGAVTVSFGESCVAKPKLDPRLLEAEMLYHNVHSINKAVTDAQCQQLVTIDKILSHDKAWRPQFSKDSKLSDFKYLSAKDYKVDATDGSGSLLSLTTAKTDFILNGKKISVITHGASVCTANGNPQCDGVFSNDYCAGEFAVYAKNPTITG